MNKTKIPAKIIARILAVVLLFLGIAYLFFRPLYYRIYPFDRITGTVRILIDGEQYDLKAGDVTATLDHSSEITVSFNSVENGSKVSIHGGQYGPYILLIHVDGLRKPLEAVVYQTNWWNVAKFDLEIKIDHAAETILFGSSAEVVNAGVHWNTETRATVFEFSDAEYMHYIVSV